MALLETEQINVQGLAGQVLDGQAHQRHLRTADGLREAACRIAETAHRLGCTNLMAASSDGEGVVAAAILLGGADMRCVSEVDVRQGTVDKVLVVEPVAITGLRVRRTARRIREAGASWVGVLVLNPISDEPAAFAVPGADAVVV